jgi:transposase
MILLCFYVRQRAPWQELCRHEGCPNVIPKDIEGRHHFCKTHKNDKYNSQKHDCSVESSFSSKISSSCSSHLTNFQRSAIVTMHVIGMDTSHIKMHTHVDPRTINKWIARAHDGDVESSDLLRSGRPHKLSTEQRKRIRQRAEDRPFVVPKMIKCEQDLCVCPRTIDRSLIADGLYGRVAKKQPAYTPAKLQARFAFGKAFEHWTEEQWACVVFSDETSFPMGECHGRPYVRRPKGKAFDPKFIWNDEAAMHSGTVKVFFAFSATARASLGFYEGALTGPKMKSIVQEYLHPFANRVFPNGIYYVIHDNDRRWGSGPVHKYLHDKYIRPLPFPWPSKSPDLNPAENIIADWKPRVWARNPGTEDELKSIIVEEWDKTDPELLRKLAKSMIKRCQKVIESKGHKIDY